MSFGIGFFENTVSYAGVMFKFFEEFFLGDGMPLLPRIAIERKQNITQLQHVRILSAAEIVAIFLASALPVADSRHRASATQLA